MERERGCKEILYFLASAVNGIPQFHRVERLAGIQLSTLQIKVM